MRALLILLLLLPVAASAQPRPPWTVTARQQTEVFDGDLDAWQVSELSAERRFSGGAAILGVGRTERFGQAAAVGMADLYKTLTPRVYANVRAAVAPGAETSARTDLAARLYAALPGGAEGVLGARRIDYAAGGATLLSAGAQLFRPWGRVGATGTLVPTNSATGVSVGLLARRDLGPPAARATRYVELRGGRGEEVVLVPGRAVDVRTSWTVSLGGETRLGQRVIVGAAVGRVWDDALSRTSAQLRLGLDL